LDRASQVNVTFFWPLNSESPGYRAHLDLAICQIVQDAGHNSAAGARSRRPRLACSPFPKPHFDFFPRDNFDEFHVGTLGKKFVPLDFPAQTQPVNGPEIGDEGGAVGVPHGSNGYRQYALLGGQRKSDQRRREVSRFERNSGGLEDRRAHGDAKDPPAPSSLHATQRPHTRSGLNLKFALGAPPIHQKSCHAPDAVPRHFSLASIRIEEAGASVMRFVTGRQDNQKTVGPYSRMSIAT